jgi:anti-sigma B factor antagonist
MGLQPRGAIDEPARDPQSGERPKGLSQHHNDVKESKAQMSDEQIVSIDPHEEIVVAVVQPSRLDEELTVKMQAEILAAAEQKRHLPVAVDLSNVQFFPSTSLGAIVSMLGKLKNHGQKLILVALQPPVRDALILTRLDKLFEIYDSLDDVLVQPRSDKAAADD